MVLYILNGNEPRHLSFITSFNIIQIKPSIHVLHNRLENYEIMISPLEMNDLESLFHANMSNFGYKGDMNRNFRSHFDGGNENNNL